MRIALIADTHGNLVALDAALDDIERQEADQIVCLGDVAGLGPWPRETLHRIGEIGCPVVMGNADEFMLDPASLEAAGQGEVDEHTRRLHDMEGWAAERLTDDDRAFIRTFQSTVEVPLGDGHALLCYHGSPRSAWEGVVATTPDDELRDMLDGHGAQYFAGGHTHQQFLPRLHDWVVINPGSVGLPFEVLPDGTGRNPPWAEYALLTVMGDALSVDLRRVPFDVERIRRGLLSSGMPHAEIWAADWR